MYGSLPAACEVEVWLPDVTHHHSTCLSTVATDLLGTKECCFSSYVLVTLRWNWPTHNHHLKCFDMHRPFLALLKFPLPFFHHLMMAPFCSLYINNGWLRVSVCSRNTRDHTLDQCADTTDRAVLVQMIYNKDKIKGFWHQDRKN